MAFRQINELVRAPLAIADQDLCAPAHGMKGRAAATAWWREVGRSDLGGNDALSFGGIGHALGNELRQRDIISMLQLAATAIRKMLARRGLMARPELKRTVCRQHVTWNCASHMLPICGNAIATCGDAENLLGLVHKYAA
ncbi:hypothetical protein GCM10022213_06430 [Parerythrobacter jejuensis]